MIGWIFDQLDQAVGPYGTRVIILLIIAVALPLILGGLARLLVFRKDEDQKKGSEGQPLTLEMLLGTEPETDDSPRDYPIVVMLVPERERNTRPQGGQTTSSAT